MLNKTILKKSLSECHIPANEKLFAFLKDASPDYQLTKAMEELSTIDLNHRQLSKVKLVLAIQLLNMVKAGIEPLADGEVA